MRAHERHAGPPSAERLAEAIESRFGPDALEGILRPGNHPALWPWRVARVESVQGDGLRSAMVVVTLRGPEGAEQEYNLQIRRAGR